MLPMGFLSSLVGFHSFKCKSTGLLIMVLGGVTSSNKEENEQWLEKVKNNSSLSFIQKRVFFKVYCFNKRQIPLNYFFPHGKKARQGHQQMN